MLLTATYSAFDAGWGCTLRAQQSAIANAWVNRAGLPPLEIASRLLSPRGTLSFSSLLTASGQSSGAWMGPSAAARAAAACSTAPLLLITAASGSLPCAAMAAALAQGGASVLCACPLRLCAGDVLDAASCAALLALARTEPAFAGLVGGPEGHCVFTLLQGEGGEVQVADPHCIKRPTATAPALLRALSHPTPGLLPLRTFASSLSLHFFLASPADLQAFCGRFPALQALLPCLCLAAAPPHPEAGEAWSWEEGEDFAPPPPPPPPPPQRPGPCCAQCGARAGACWPGCTSCKKGLGGTPNKKNICPLLRRSQGH